MFVELRSLIIVLSSLLLGCAPEKAADGSQSQASINQIFKSNDLNKDKCLSESEWRKMSELSTDIIKSEASNPGQFQDWTLELFDEMDSDKNKCVSLEEYIEFSKHSRSQGG